MTNLIGRIISQMSSAFNQTIQSEEVSITADKTLKWRGLHNNQYASKDGRLIGRRSKRIKSELLDESESMLPDNNVCSTDDIADEQKFVIAPQDGHTETEDIKYNIDVPVPSSSSSFTTIPIDTILSYGNINSRQLKDIIAFNTITPDKNNVASDDKQRASKLKIKNIHKSDRNLRSSLSLSPSTPSTLNPNANISNPNSNNNSINTTPSKHTDNAIDILKNTGASKTRLNRSSMIQSPTTETVNKEAINATADKSQENNNESAPPMKRRGRKKKSSMQSDETTSNSETLVNEEEIEVEPRISCSQQADDEETIANGNAESVVDSVKKRRGRKPKLPPIILPSTSPSARLSRRIKPTAKILANEELRQGFELHNNARIVTKKKLESARILMTKNSRPNEDAVKKPIDPVDPDNVATPSTPNDQKLKEKFLFHLGLKRVRKPSDNSDSEVSDSDKSDGFIPKTPDGSMPTQSPAANKKPRRCNLLQTPMMIQKKKVRNRGIKLLPTRIPKALNPPASQQNEEPIKLICTCTDKFSLYASKTAIRSICSAIDHIGQNKIGCNRVLLNDPINLVRPSKFTSYMSLCNVHMDRLRAHNCCAFCGEFCTQGYVVLCQNGHFFHKICADKFSQQPSFGDKTHSKVLKCPHCNIETCVTTTLCKMKCNRVPVFSVCQRYSIKSGNNQDDRRGFKDNNFLLKIEELIPDDIFHILDKFNESPARQYTSKDLFYAICRYKDINKIAEIIVSGFDILTTFEEYHNGTCLHLASNFGNISMIYLILCRASCNDFLNLFDSELRTALMCAVVGQKNDIIKLLLQCGADVTLKGPDGKTALHLASKIGNITGVKIILDLYKENGTTQNLISFINAVDEGHWTALVWAAEYGHIEIVKLLLESGADVNVCDLENNTALHWAALQGRVEVCHALLSTKINCNLQNINGDTALHLACRTANPTVCRYLMSNGACLNIQNLANETPLDCVTDKNNNCAKVLNLNQYMQNLGTFPKKLIRLSDITNGREVHPIQITGYLNSNKSNHPQHQKPIPKFKYITKNITISNEIHIQQRISSMKMCLCEDNCINSSCICSESVYNHSGRLNENYDFNKPQFIFECSDVCSCNKMICKNRVVQKGVRYPMQVIECEDEAKGWGVKSLTNIPKGGFVAEYIGELLTKNQITDNPSRDKSYMFDLGSSNHFIDAKYYGNISRLFNHSCEPNITPVRVFYGHNDIRFPKIAFFANRDINIDEELSFDYLNGFHRIKDKLTSCCCKSPKCRFQASS